MSLRFLCEEITWSKRVFLPLNDLITMASRGKKDFLNQLESLITLSVRYSCLFEWDYCLYDLTEIIIPG